MTIADAVGRIAQIQAAIVQLDGLGKGLKTTGATAGGGAVGGTGSAAAFAQALTGALGTSGLPGGAAVGGVDAAAAAGTTGATGADVVADAKKYLGVPYVFGGTSASGLDCSGLVQRVFKDLGIDVPRLVSGQSTVGTAVPSLAQAQPGDLIVTNGGEHIVIYAGDGKVIHAPSEGRTVSLVNNWMKDSDIVTIRRVVPTTAQAAASASTASAAGTSASAAQADTMRAMFAALLQGGAS